MVVNGNFKTFRGSQVKGIIKGLRVKKEWETIFPSNLRALLDVDVLPESFLFEIHVFQGRVEHSLRLDDAADPVVGP